MARSVVRCTLSSPLLLPSWCTLFSSSLLLLSPCALSCHVPSRTYVTNNYNNYNNSNNNNRWNSKPAPTPPPPSPRAPYTPPSHPLSFNPDISEPLSPIAETKNLLAKHEKGYNVQPNEILSLVPLVDSASAMNLYKIAKDKGYFNSEVATAFYNAFITAHGKHKKVDEALQLFNEMNQNNIRITVATYNSLIGIFANNNRVEEALGLFRSMEESGVYPNSRTFSVILNVYGKLLDVENVGAVLRNMREKGVAPDASVYTILIEMYLAMDQEDEALKILELMKKGPVTQQPDSVTWGTFLAYYDKKENLEKMRECFVKLLQDKGRLNAKPFSHMMRAYNRREMFQEAIQILELAKQHKVRLAEVLLSSALHAYSMLGEYNGCLAIRRHMAAHHIKFDTQAMNALMRIWLRAKMYPKVYEVLNDMVHLQIPRNEMTYALACDLYACDNLWARLERELQIMKHDSIPLTSLTLSTLAKHFNKKEELERIVERGGWELGEMQEALQSIYSQ